MWNKQKYNFQQNRDKDKNTFKPKQSYINGRPTIGPVVSHLNDRNGGDTFGVLIGTSSRYVDRGKHLDEQISQRHENQYTSLLTQTRVEALISGKTSTRTDLRHRSSSTNKPPSGGDSRWSYTSAKTWENTTQAMNHNNVSAVQSLSRGRTGQSSALMTSDPVFTRSTLHDNRSAYKRANPTTESLKSNHAENLSHVGYSNNVSEPVSSTFRFRSRSREVDKTRQERQSGSGVKERSDHLHTASQKPPSGRDSSRSNTSAKTLENKIQAMNHDNLSDLQYLSRGRTVQTSALMTSVLVSTRSTSHDNRLAHKRANPTTEPMKINHAENSYSVSEPMSLTLHSTSHEVVKQTQERQSRAGERGRSDRLRSSSQGLRNLGNTCYMNSILQCLAKVRWFRVKTEQPYIDDFLEEFFSLMEKMSTERSVSRSHMEDEIIDPIQFRKQAQNLGFRFSSSQQNDAHEFLLCLLSRLSESLDKEFGKGKDSNAIRYLLRGEQENSTKMLEECLHEVNCSQPFYAISLPMPSKQFSSGRYTTGEIELEDCLKKYTEEEFIMDEDNLALCMECNEMRRCSIQTMFTRLPPYLFFHLKRFDLQKFEKLETKIRFPRINLRLDEKGGRCFRYDLIGICNHSGSLRSGHYTADVMSNSGKWYNYNDSWVRESTAFSLSGEKDFMSSSTAYIFLYERQCLD